MRFCFITILIALLVFCAPQKTMAQSTKKYSIDLGPVDEPISRKFARMRAKYDKKHKEHLSDRIKEKQEKEFEKARAQSIKKHLANQSPALRKRLEKEMKNGSLPNQAEKRDKKITRIKKKRENHG
jgi:hypothetical protein